MGRGPFDETRQGRSRNYRPGSRPPNNRGGGHPRDDYDDDRDYERGYDRYGNRSYDNYSETSAERYYREQEARRNDTRNTAIKWTGVVLVALIAGVALILIVFALTGGSEGAQPIQQPPQQAQPVPQQQAPQQAPQTPAIPDNSQQVEGLRAEIQRQFAELRQSIESLRLQIWGLWASGQSQDPQQ